MANDNDTILKIAHLGATALAYFASVLGADEMVLGIHTGSRTMLESWSDFRGDIIA